MDWQDPFGWLFAGVIALMLALVGWFIWYAAQPHETYALDAREWTCTEHETRFIPITTVVNRVPVTTMAPQRVCVRYERNE